MSTRTRGQHFFYFLWLAVAALCLVLLWRFLSVILIAAALAVVLHPVFRALHRALGGYRTLAALLVIVLLSLVFGVPLYFLGSKVVYESRDLYFDLADGSGHWESLTVLLERFLPFLQQVDWPGALGGLTSFLAGTTAFVFSATLQTFLTLLLTLLALFYFLRDGERWLPRLVELSPLSDDHDARLLSMFAQAVNGVMLGYLLIAVLQGTLLGLGLFVFGVPQPALWGVAAGFAAMIPLAGTALVSLPAIIFLILSGSWASALGLALWAMVLVGLVDNLLTPLVVGRSLALPPLVVLLSVLGGIALLGPVGIMVGPLALSFFYTLTLIYQEHFKS